ncbi:MAG: T9SS type A sorting domain-containing protein [Bacteroidetes bacterium]|nr:T9SS type A sorting domain-containing protein [Bacteroidota bacterium]
MKRNLLLLCLIMNLVPVLAAKRNVPGDYPKIQQAINASVNGDTIVVAPGTYFENINFRGRNVLLTSLFYLDRDTSYITSTIINGSTPADPDTASCVIFNSGEDSTAILQGFTLMGGLGTQWVDIHGAGIFREGGGVIIELSSPTVRFNIIRNNQAINTQNMNGAGGGGIRIGDGNPVIEDNIITGNQGQYGPGIVLNYTGCRIRNNIIAGNSGGLTYNGGSGIWMAGDHSLNLPKIIENNTIVNNYANAGATGGIALLSATNVTLRNNIIWGNIPEAQQIKPAGSTFTVDWCDVQGGFTGDGNLNEDPQFDPGCYTLNPGSPCIDAGDSNAIYNDLLSAPGVAKFPSMGTGRNDIGAFGGPGAFLLACHQWTAGIELQAGIPNEILVYPNPSSGRLVIERTRTDPPDERVELVTLSGELVKTGTIAGKTMEINIADLPDGVYMLHVTGIRIPQAVKVIKTGSYLK